MTTATPDLALRYFGNEIASAAAYGDDQVDYVTGQVLTEFHKKAMHATFVSILDDVKAKHADLLDRGIIDQSPIEQGQMSAIAIPGGDALAIKLSDDKNVLLAWSTDADGVFTIHALPWVAPVPTALLDEAERFIESGMDSMTAINEQVRRLAPYGGMPGKKTALRDYGNVTLNEIVDAFGDHPFDQVGQRLGVASFQIKPSKHGPLEMARPRLDRYNDVLDALSKCFALKTADFGIMSLDMGEHLEAVRKGELLALHDSLCALSLSNHVDRRLKAMGDLVESAEELGLNRDLELAYNDTDIRVHVERTADKDVWVNSNIDMNEQNVFVTVLHGKPGSYTSLDVHLGATWYADDVEELPENREDFFKLVSYAADAGHRTNVDEIVAALKDGRTAASKVLSYDFATKTAEILPSIGRTGYLDHLSLMIESDLEAITDALAGNVGNHIGFELHRRPNGSSSLDARESVSIVDHLRERAPAP